MGWEEVEALPGAGSGGRGAFRDGAAPVIAQRIGLTLRERVRLWWRSTPELPIGRAAEWIVVAPQHLYVQRVDGTRARVRLDELHGERLQNGLLVYGVREDEDLLFAYRPRCEVQNRLAASLRGDASVEPWQDAFGVTACIILAWVAGILCAGLLLTYSLEGTLEHIQMGLYTSEHALGTYAGFGSFLLALVFFLWVPSRWRVDALGVTCTRGVLPWLPFTRPPESFRAVVLSSVYSQPKRGRRYHSGWGVDLELKRPTRVGSIFRRRRVRLGLFLCDHKRSGASYAKAEKDARALAERVRSLLSLDDIEERPAKS